MPRRGGPVLGSALARSPLQGCVYREHIVDRAEPQSGEQGHRARNAGGERSGVPERRGHARAKAVPAGQSGRVSGAGE